ncbi:MAG: cell division protein FtsW [Planctomyces sp.]|nr:cell division protein FtsW [Planctomyces sp.]
MTASLKPLFLGLTAILLGVGVMLVFSASVSSRPGDPEVAYIAKHLVFLALAAAIGGAASQVSPETWRRLAPYLFLGTVVLLVLVLIPGLGVKVNGARRWFRMAGLSLQPSELAKLTLPLYLATVLEKQRRVGATFRSDLARMLGPLAGVSLLVLVEPDLGTAALLMATGAVVLWSGGWPLRRMLAAAVLASPGLLGLLFLKPYQWQRITGFVDAWTAPHLAPYQIRQSLLTLGVGGWFGQGLGAGWQKLSYLPEANTDFVFSVVGEELGLVGTLSVVAAWIGLYVVGLRLIDERRGDWFARTVGFTWLTMLVFQAALNIAVVTALVPPKGVSHPLISYGGTSLLVSVTILGAFCGLMRPRDGSAVPE